MPQGSILDLLLFILYINDISKTYDLLFADDTCVFIEGTVYGGIIKAMNRELEQVDKWLKSNKYTITILYLIRWCSIVHELKTKHLKIDNTCVGGG